MPPQGRSFTTSLSAHWRRVALGIGVVLATVLLIVLACTQQTPFVWFYHLGIGQPYSWANAMSLQSISMVSADDGWAVGHISGKPTTLLMHYSRGQWMILPKPVGLDDQSEFTAVSMVSASDGWAWASMPIPIGDRYHSFRPGGVLLHYDGTAWKIATHVFPIGIGNDPSALLMLSPTDGWATGENTTLHYDGTAWHEVTALSDQQWGGGSAIAATSPHDIWIVRFGGDIINYDGTSWTEQRITLAFGQQLPGAIQLNGIAMLSPSEGFAVGDISNSSSGVILHYAGGRWSVQSTVDEYLYSISLRSPTDGWAVGAAGGIYHDVAGVWTKAARPVLHPLYGVTALPSGSDPLAVGLGGVLLRYRDGAWQQETNVVWSKDAQAEWK
jgi:hypothetical protein